MAFAESFLRFPDLFPARAAGERWGAHERRLDLPGGPLAVSGLSAGQDRWLGDRQPRDTTGAARVEDEDAAAVAVSVFRAASEDFLDDRSDGRWLDLDHRRDEVRLAGHGFLARIEWCPRPSCALWTCYDGGKDFGGGWQNFLRVVLAYALLDRGGALLHSAGVVDEGRAHLFVGRSGAGKSTLARLSLETGRAVLSDDLNAALPERVAPEGGTWYAAQVPFTGELRTGVVAGAGSIPLGGVYRLAQGPAHRLTPLDAGAALTALLACSPFVNADPYRLDRLGDNLERLIARLGVATLTFARDAGFWEQALRARSFAKVVGPAAEA